MSAAAAGGGEDEAHNLHFGIKTNPMNWAVVADLKHPRSRSAARKLLTALLEGSYTLVRSNELIVETTRVPRYPRARTRTIVSRTILKGSAYSLDSLDELSALLRRRQLSSSISSTSGWRAAARHSSKALSAATRS